MNSMRLFLLALGVCLALVACQPQGDAETIAIEVSLGEVFTLAGGQEGVVNGEALRLKFDEVLEDSRCPTEVECVWTGQARIALLIRQGEAEPVRVEFNTNPAPGQNKQTAEIGDYTVELQSLDPYPETTEAIPFEDYRASLIITQAD